MDRRRVGRERQQAESAVLSADGCGAGRLERETNKWNEFAGVVAVILNTVAEDYELAKPYVDLVAGSEAGRRRACAD